MSYFYEQLKLAEKAAEDIYCARLDRELIESLHRQMQAGEHALHTSARPGVETPANGSKPAVQVTTRR